MQLRSALKKVVPQRILAFWRLGEERAGLKRRINEFGQDHSLNSVVLIGTPLHENLGDHLITLGTREFLSLAFPERAVVEVPIEGYRLYWPRIRKSVSEDDIILINGGGWMGDVYPEDECVIQHVATHFSGNKILVLPQTMFYADMGSKNAKKLIQSGRNAFSNASDFNLCLRERGSLRLANELYPDVKRYLVPDMALAYYQKAPKGQDSESSGRVGVCLRDDKERSLNDRAKKEIMDVLEQHHKIPVPITTMAGRKVYSAERQAVVTEKLSEFASCDLIVTDRLHAMIFSFLAGTPCIAFDNATKKVSGVYDAWLRPYREIQLLTEPGQLARALTTLENQNKDDKVSTLGFSYEILKELIIGEQD